MTHTAYATTITLMHPLIPLSLLNDTHTLSRYSICAYFPMSCYYNPTAPAPAIPTLATTTTTTTTTTTMTTIATTTHCPPFRWPCGRCFWGREESWRVCLVGCLESYSTYRNPPPLRFPPPPPPLLLLLWIIHHHHHISITHRHRLRLLRLPNKPANVCWWAMGLTFLTYGCYGKTELNWNTVSKQVTITRHTYWYNRSYNCSDNWPLIPFIFIHILRIIQKYNFFLLMTN